MRLMEIILTDNIQGQFLCGQLEVPYNYDLDTYGHMRIWGQGNTLATSFTEDYREIEWMNEMIFVGNLLFCQLTKDFDWGKHK